MQTSHNEYRSKYSVGQLIGQDNRIETVISEDAGDIDIGQSVFKGTNDNQAKKPTGAFTLAAFQGVVIKNQVLEKAIGTGNLAIEDEESFSVVTKGRIAVLVEDTVAKGDDVFFVHTAGTSSQYTYRTDLDTNKASQIPAKFLESGVTGDILLIDVNADLSVAI